MRLPQSFSHAFPTRVFSSIAIGLFAATLPVSGWAATQQLTCGPSSMRFGSVVVGQSETAVVALTNSGQTSITVSAISGSGPFSAPGANLPLTVPAGQSVPLNVTFSPTAAGWIPGTVTFTSNAANSTTTLAVRGTGVSRVGLGTSPASVSFGQVAVGSSSQQPLVLTNLRSYKIQISALQTAGNGFSVSATALPITLSAGQSITLQSTFTPKSTGIVAGSVFIIGPNVNVPLSGTGTTTTTATGLLSVAPTPVNFGNVTVGNTGTQAITLSASGASVTVSADTSNNSQFVLSGASLPVTIPAGQSKMYNMTFTPTGTGTVSASLSFTSNASNSPNVALSGTGTAVTGGQLSVAPTTLNFGNVAVGTTGTQIMTLSASGASVTVSADGSSNSQFVLSGISLPLTIPAGQSTSYNVSFTPSGGGTVSGTLSFTSNASNSKMQESLTGTGTVQQYSVSLSWNASGGVAGYNIYRSTSANGSYAKVNPTLDANTAYTDSSVISGQTYYYEATAVNSSGQESSRSTPPVQAAIP